MGEPRLLRESVWAMALALSYASRFGANVGVEVGTMDRCSEMADRLERATGKGMQ